MYIQNFKNSKFELALQLNIDATSTLAQFTTDAEGTTFDTSEKSTATIINITTTLEPSSTTESPTTTSSTTQETPKISYGTRPPTSTRPHDRINSETSEIIALVIGIIAGALIAVILIILVILKFKSRSDRSYKVDDGKGYQQGPNTALLGNTSTTNGQTQYQMNGSLRNGSEKNGQMQKKKRESKDIKEWYIPLKCSSNLFYFETKRKEIAAEHVLVYNFWYLLYKFTKNSKLDIVTTAKLFLHSIDYRCLPFYSLPNDMSCGSRELLLALGFAMNKNNLLYEMIQNKIEATPINPKYSFLPTPIRKSMRCENEMFESKDQKAMQWIKGRTNITKRLCCETQNKINKLLKQAEFGYNWGRF
ncbi:Tubulin epsilon and delta complex protein 1 [Popillia japonica]|uniref:Tubulin epsilon and delta complex protein 1 n=1 Tax=Popillia japonica TaxID=7064 RepID=A0AAW1IXK4_POPJA